MNTPPTDITTAHYVNSEGLTMCAKHTDIQAVKMTAKEKFYYAQSIQTKTICNTCREFLNNN